MRIHGALAAAGLLLLSTSASGAVDEGEPNDTIGTANVFPGPEEVNGELRRDLQDVVDYFVFTGLIPGETHPVRLDNAFLGLGIFNANGDEIDSIAFSPPHELDAVADLDGEVIVGVCGHEPMGVPVLDCTATAEGSGPYLLTLPEPRTLPSSIAALAGIAALRRRGRLR